MTKPKFKIRKLISYALLTFVLLLTCVYFVDWFFDSYNLEFQSPILFQEPILIQKRPEYINPFVEQVKAKEPEPVVPKTWDEVAVMVIDKFKDEGKHVTFDALKIAFCESGWEEKAIHKNRNKSVDYGAFQINSIHKQTNMLDAEANIEFAKKLYEDQGFNPWVCKP